MTTDPSLLARVVTRLHEPTELIVAVTGGTGFVGAELIDTLVDRGRAVRSIVRGEARPLPGIEVVSVGEIDETTRWDDALAGVHVIVHLAARVHVMHDHTADPLAQFRRTNVGGSLRLAEQAATAGVRRFIFVSSVKVNGEAGIYRETDPPQPQGPYAVSKAEAEEGLRVIGARTGMEVVIIRPPLIYGREAKGNFRRLADALQRGIPLPLGAIHNKRSLMALGNLIDFIVTCIDHPAAPNQTFLVSDGEDLSTTELVHRLAEAMGSSSRIVPVPERLLSAIATVLGKRGLAQRLLGSLQVDISKAQELLEWIPPLSVDAALRLAVTRDPRL